MAVVSGYLSKTSADNFDPFEAGRSGDGFGKVSLLCVFHRNNHALDVSMNFTEIVL